MSADFIRCARCLMGVRVGGNRSNADQWRCPDCRVLLFSGHATPVGGKGAPITVSIAPQDVERFPGHDPL